MKNFLKVIVIILSLSVTFMIGILNVNAEEHDFSKWKDVSEFHLPNNISADNNYIVIWKRGGTAPGGYRMVYFPKTYTNAQVATDNDLSGLFPYAHNLAFYNGTSWFNLNYYQTDSDSDYYFPNSSSGTNAAYNVGAGGYVVYSNINIHRGTAIYDYGIWFDTEWLNSPFDITYEQGEVIMSNYENASANLISQYIETDLNPQDYTFSYYYNTGGGLQNVIYEPICSESLVNNNIHYSCYYNIPLFYNTTLTFNIDDKNTSDSVYSFIFNAYLPILPDSSNYNIYRFTGYKYANISGINSGTFGLSQYTYTSILHDIKTEIDYDIYVYDSSTGTKEDFITSPYYVSTNIDNNIIYRTFDFNGNSNLYLTIVLNDYTKYIDFDSDIFLFSPNTAYTHLSTPVECYNTEDISTCEHLATLPQNQQSYKDSNNNTVNESNPINYYDNENDFFNQLDSLFGSNQSFKGLTGVISSPLNVIRNLTTSSTCTDINLPIPYVNKYITLPCMSSIYSTYFGDFFTLYQSVTFAIVGYFIIIKFIATIKDLYNPDKDEIEVVDL